MPFKSKKQRKYMFAKHPKIAKKWAKEYDNGGLVGWLEDLKEKRKKKYSTEKFDSGDTEAYKGKSLNEMMAMQEKKRKEKDKKDEYRDGGMAYRDGGKAEDMKHKAKKGALMVIIGMGKPKKKK